MDRSPQTKDALVEAVESAVEAKIAPLREMVEAALAARSAPKASTQREILSSPEAAEYLGLGHQTLVGWRHRGVGPAYALFGRRVAYRRSDLDAWIKARLRTTSEAPR